MKQWRVVIASALILWFPVILLSTPFVSESMLQRLKLDYSDQAYRRGIALNKLLVHLEKKEIKTQLIEVNRFFNQFFYKADHLHWGKKDYWATPEEFIGTQHGDCEDFVIAKYFVLRKLGVPDNRLYLTYVKALKQNVAHMVLSYFEKPSSTPLILDNYNPVILRADKRRNLLPIYSFNANSLFLTNASAGLGRSLPTDKIKNSKWAKLLADIRNEK
ncbi:MAG: transglutaminase-like cysteine peptidase [Colwellia sp.]|nr:transglutaminase-like cysteine peptidase [Colwellia sp.]